MTPKKSPAPRRAGARAQPPRVCANRVDPETQYKLLGEAVGGRRLARTPPRRVTRWLAASTRHRLQRSLQPAMTPVPITLF